MTEEWTQDGIRMRHADPNGDKDLLQVYQTARESMQTRFGQDKAPTYLILTQGMREKYNTALKIDFDAKGNRFILLEEETARGYLQRGQGKSLEFMFAHEDAHFRLKHKPTLAGAIKQTDQEIEADVVATWAVGPEGGKMVMQRNIEIGFPVSPGYPSFEQRKQIIDIASEGKSVKITLDGNCTINDIKAIPKNDRDPAQIEAPKRCR
jgi:hypothetical protein